MTATRKPRAMPVVRLLVASALASLSGCRAAQPPSQSSEPRQEPTAAGPRPPVAKADVPRGIYALIDWNRAPSAATWQNPAVDGVVIRTYWRDLNPQDRVYEWKYLDSQFAAAVRAKKNVRLMIAPGFYAPDHVLHDPKVRKATFKVPHGPLSGKQRPLPLPWDETYLTRWFGFVDQLAARYRHHSALSYISATGPNSHNGEVSLPREAGDLRAWELLGSASTIEANLLGAWQKTIDHFCRAFEGKHFTLAIISKSLAPLPRHETRDFRPDAAKRLVAQRELPRALRGRRRRREPGADALEGPRSTDRTTPLKRRAGHPWG